MSTTQQANYRALAAAGLALALAAPARAVPFNLGTLEGQVDTKLTLSAGWATAAPDRDLIGIDSGGRALAPSSDDGRLNFARGETFAKRFTGEHAIELKYGRSGAFLRGRYWYDFELQDEQGLDDSGRLPGARSAGAQLLDAFVYRDYHLGERPGSVRLGRQVLHWGEGLFLDGGLDAINPRDAAALRRPATELRDGLLPVGLLHVTQDLSDSLSVEAFYQLAWEPTVLENCGTFLSPSDLLPHGCRAELRLRPDRQLLSRAADREARDAGQFGLAAHYYSAPLDTEFGAWFANYHSRAPLLSVTAADPARGVAGQPRYFVEYPEDIRLYGLSFATTLASGAQWRGELAYRPAAPVQLSTSDLLLSAQAPADPLSPLPLGAGQELQGYRRKAVTQLQTGISQVLDQAMGADRLTLSGELGWTHVAGLESRAQLRYGRDPAFGPGGAGCAALNAAVLGSASAGNVARYCESDGFTTRDAWGYRLKAVWDFDRALAGIDLKPSLAWAHDVAGYSPGPDGTFVEGRKALSLGLDADYLETYSASLAYTDFFGGRYSTLSDRDFLTLSVGVRF
jgi:hypothetical protein